VGDPRKLVAVFQNPVSDFMLRLAPELGFHSVLVEPDPSMMSSLPRPHGDQVVHDLGAAGLDEFTDVVVTDHHRAEVDDILAQAVAARTRWVGIVGSPHRDGPDRHDGRVHRPIGLNIGSAAPAEIAVAILAGLIADRNGRPGGFEF
jgi:xanthine dehydrogenase accessory factor